MLVGWLPHLYVFSRLLPLAWLLGNWLPRALALSLGLSLAAVLTPLGSPWSVQPTPAQIVVGLLRELCIGGVFAIAAQLAIASVGWVVRLAQPAGSRAPLAELERMYVLCAAWSLLALGGLRALVRALAQSLQDAPIGGAALDHHAFALGVAQLISSALVGAIGLAVPLAIGALLLELMLAWAARAVGTRAEGWLGPTSYLLLAGLMLVPIVMRAPAMFRVVIEAARALTRSLAR